LIELLGINIDILIESIVCGFTGDWAHLLPQFLALLHVFIVSAMRLVSDLAASILEFRKLS